MIPAGFEGFADGLKVIGLSGALSEVDEVEILSMQRW